MTATDTPTGPETKAKMWNMVDVSADRLTALEAVLTAARNILRHPTETDVNGWIEALVPIKEWDEFERTVSAADAPPPTERAESHADAPNPQNQGQNP